MSLSAFFSSDEDLLNASQNADDFISFFSPKAASTPSKAHGNSPCKLSAKRSAKAKESEPEPKKHGSKIPLSFQDHVFQMRNIMLKSYDLTTVDEPPNKARKDRIWISEVQENLGIKEVLVISTDKYNFTDFRTNTVGHK